MTVAEKIKETENFYKKTGIDYSDCQIEEILKVSPKSIFPRYKKIDLENKKTEWDLINKKYIASEEFIQVSINSNGELVVNDGHHRLYRDLNKKFIKVIVVDKINNYFM